MFGQSKKVQMEWIRERNTATDSYWHLHLDKRLPNLYIGQGRTTSDKEHIKFFEELKKIKGVHYAEGHDYLLNIAFAKIMNEDDIKKRVEKHIRDNERILGE